MLLIGLSLPLTDPVVIFALVMLVVLTAPLLFARLRIPSIVGLLIAGMVIGPHALGLLARDQTIQLLGTVGLLYIMFIAGLEVNLNEFSKYRHRSLLFGALTFSIPQLVGTCVARVVLGFGWAPALLLGSVFASHTLVAYPIISRLGLSKTQAVTTAVGATIFTDTAALLVLAVIARSAEGGIDAAFWVQLITLLSAYVVGVLWCLPRLGRWFLRTVRAGGAEDFVFILAAVFTCAFLAQLAGVESIIGAFLAGLALNRLVPEHSTLMNRLKFVGDSLFIPFFLISVGMLVDLRVFSGDARAWLVAGSMLATILATKWLAAMATRPLLGYSKAQGWMLFGLTVPQAAATLAAAIVGFNIGLFDANVLNGTIVMIMITCMIGPWFAEKYGRQVALQVAQEPFRASDVPQRIHIPLSNPDTTPFLMELALMIRDPASEQPVFPLVVVHEGSEVEGRVAAAEKLLGHAVVYAAAADVPVMPATRLHPNVASGISRAVTERLISTVVIGWNGENTARSFIFGSILDQLLQESREMVLVCKIEQPLGTVGKVVLAVPPFAGREPGFPAALRAVKILASQAGARLLLVGLEEGMPALLEGANRLRPDVPVAYQSIDAWPRLVPALDRLVDRDDLLVLLSVRAGTLAWRPSLHRLPRVAAQRFARNSLVVLYAAETLPSAGHVDTPSQEEPPLLTEKRITIHLAESTPSLLLHRMLKGAFAGRPAGLQDVIAQLDEYSPDYAPELFPGVVLYHTHAEAIDEPLLFMGTSEGGLKLPHIDDPVYVVLVLLSPASHRPEDHLRRLAEVARLIPSDEALARLRSAATPGEVYGLVMHGLHTASP